MPHRRARTAAATAALLTLAALVAACGSVSAAALGRGGVRIVAAENFWGAIAGQIGGAHASVRSIIANPAQDPHAYEPTAGDARTMAIAQLAIVNGLGYDPWASQLLDADPADGRTVLDVGARLHLPAGANPHRWYDPADVQAVATAIAAALKRLDHRHAAYFARRLTRFERRGLAAYHELIAQIRRRYAGTPVGASESIFSLLAPALGVRLITPPGFMKATSEGTELTSQDTAAAERQIATRAIRVWVENTQNLTPEVQRLDALARAARIPVVAVTETLVPAGGGFAPWQAGQLRALAAALARATGR